MALPASVPIIFATQPTGLVPAAFLDEDFAFLLAQINALFISLPFNPIIVTTPGPFLVDPLTRAMILNKAVASPTTIQLGGVVARAGLPFSLSDWGGDGGDVTLLPAAGETIMGLASATLSSLAQGFGTAASTTIYPSGALSGWYTT